MNRLENYETPTKKSNNSTMLLVAAALFFALNTGGVIQKNTINNNPIQTEQKDSDNDGVGNDKDLCPDTKEGIKVDEFGCPVDSDGDGLTDDNDDCPDEYGPMEYAGCPESPDTTGTEQDIDNDGVGNDKDLCPDTKEGIKVDASGCPIDFDHDGLPDDVDYCPDEYGPMEYLGCPESPDTTGIEKK